MKTISLKIPDELYEKVEKYRKLENVNRTSFVLEAVAEYSKRIEREELGKKLRDEVRKDREINQGLIDEWDVTVNDGLTDDDW